MGHAKRPPAAGEAGEKPGGLSPGLGAFLRGGSTGGKPETQPELLPAAEVESRNPNPREGNGNQNGSETSPTPEAHQLTGNKRLLHGTLVLADVLLVGLAARLAIKAHGHLGFGEVALCVLAVGMGAWLACLAVLRK